MSGSHDRSGPRLPYERMNLENYHGNKVPVVTYDSAGAPSVHGYVNAYGRLVGAGGNKEVHGVVLTALDGQEIEEMAVPLGPAKGSLVAQPLQSATLSTIDRQDIAYTFGVEHYWYDRFRSDAMGQPRLPTTRRGPRGEILQSAVELGHGLEEAIDVLKWQQRYATRSASGERVNLMMYREASEYMLLNLLAGARYALDSFHTTQIADDQNGEWFPIYPVHKDIGVDHVNNLLVEARKGEVSVIDVSHVLGVRVRNQTINEAVLLAGDDVVAAAEALDGIREINQENRTFTAYMRALVEDAGLSHLIPVDIWRQPVWKTRDLQDIALAALRRFSARLNQSNGARYSDSQARDIAAEEYYHAFLWTRIYGTRNEVITNARNGLVPGTPLADARLERLKYYEDNLMDLPQEVIAAYALAIDEWYDNDQPTVALTISDLPPRR